MNFLGIELVGASSIQEVELDGWIMADATYRHPSCVGCAEAMVMFASRAYHVSLSASQSVEYVHAKNNLLEYRPQRVELFHLSQ